MGDADPRAWADAGKQCWEITREDILDVLPAKDTRASRSATGCARSSPPSNAVGIIADPITGMRIRNVERRIPMPINTEIIRAAFESADPTTAAITTLVGIHGLGHVDLCLLLTDRA